MSSDTPSEHEINKITDGDELARLSKHEDIWVRAVVAVNPNTPTAVLEELSRDGHSSVRISVLDNPNASEGLVQRMTRDRDPVVARAAQDDFNKM